MAFDVREVEDDGYGNTVGGDWEEQFIVYAELKSRGGSEAVAAARLEGRSVFGVYVRASGDTQRIAANWRMRDVRRGTEYNVIHVDAVTEPGWVYLEAQSGAAIG